MITGCIAKMRAQDCGTCDHRKDCAFIVPELLGRLFQPAPMPRGEQPPQRRGGAFLRMLFEEIAGAARREMAKAKERPDSLRRRVETELEPLLATGPTRIGPVARSLGCSRQTLYRRLKAEGITFAQVLDGLRRREALRLVGDPALPVKEIAWRLGFSDPAAFSRAFKRWTGKSPQAFRAQSG